MFQWVKNPKLIWNSLQYLFGLRDSRLVRLTKRPSASYRAVALGLPEAHWEAFETAYPEFEIIFAKPDVTANELHLALATNNTALLAFSGASRLLIQVACRQLNVQVFQASFAPIPILERNGEIARGFLIDSMGDWLKARRPTELSIFLEYFDFSARSQLIAAAKHLLAINPPLPLGEGCLILPSATAAAASTVGTNADETELRDVATDYTSPEKMVFFRYNHADAWAAPEVIFDFINSLQTCKIVVVSDNPLGLLAVLSGCEVVVSERPFWAGFGLTKDLHQFKRHRSLTHEELVALLIFVLSRYVNESNRLIDPADDWALPTPERGEVGAFSDPAHAMDQTAVSPLDKTL